jgi:hypothetical protein
MAAARGLHSAQRSPGSGAAGVRRQPARRPHLHHRHAGLAQLLLRARRQPAGQLHLRPGLQVALLPARGGVPPALRPVRALLAVLALVQLLEVLLQRRPGLAGLAAHGAALLAGQGGVGAPLRLHDRAHQLPAAHQRLGAPCQGGRVGGGHDAADAPVVGKRAAQVLGDVLRQHVLRALVVQVPKDEDVERALRRQPLRQRRHRLLLLLLARRLLWLLLALLLLLLRRSRALRSPARPALAPLQQLGEEEVRLDQEERRRRRRAAIIVGRAAGRARARASAPARGRRMNAMHAGDAAARLAE